MCIGGSNTRPSGPAPNALSGFPSPCTDSMVQLTEFLELWQRVQHLKCGPEGGGGHHLMKEGWGATKVVPIEGQREGGSKGRGLGLGLELGDGGCGWDGGSAKRVMGS